MEIEFGKMCMDSVALVSVDMLILHGLEGLVMEAMDPGGSWIQSVDCIFSNFVDFVTISILGENFVLGREKREKKSYFSKSEILQWF